MMPFVRDVFDFDPFYDVMGAINRPSMFGDDWLMPSSRSMMPSMGWPYGAGGMVPRRGMGFSMPGMEMMGRLEQMAPRGNVINDRNQFAVNVDVRHFRPEEISVKTAGDYVTVEGRHEDREDEQGYIRRHFVRKYMLPDNVKAENVKSTLSSDGVLTISAPKEQKALEHGGEREIPIQKVPYPAVATAAQKSVGQGQEQQKQQQPMEQEQVQTKQGQQAGKQ
jgi:crystallin alpha B